ncbi:APC family permease [Pseudalkalibacillus decolorationis]|uniref:APC family permease n=1 Tax=Pseudalkalibacillus decolorationis TaxID=163879 RepID=UPI0021484B93|nr:APC family permease [Pseudalkalibacillus decolorationis]
MSQKQSDFTRVLSRIDVFFLAIGSMLGWSWVALSGTWVTSAGSMGSIVSFVIGGFLIIFVGLTYAELASAMPQVGGEHAYVLRAMGRNASFIVSWMLALGYISVVAFEAVALPTVVDYIVPNYEIGYMWTIAGWDVYFSWALIGIIGSIIITAVNYFGIKQAAFIQIVLSAVILLMGVMLIFGSMINGDSSNLKPLFVDGAIGVTTVLVMVPFLFVGFDVIPQVAEEINLPFRQIGKILMISVVCVAVFYAFISLGVSLALDQTELGTTELATADAMKALFGSEFFAYLLILGGVAGIITSWNALMIGASRVLYAMAKSGMIPVWFGYLHPKYKTPTNAVFAIGVPSVLSPLLGRPALVWLVNAGGFGIVISYFMVAIAFIVLRKKEPDMERPYRSGKSSAVGWIAAVFCLGFITLYLPGMPASLSWPTEWVLVGAWVIIGLYYFVQMNRSKYGMDNESSSIDM